MFDALLIASQAQFANEGGGGTSLNVDGLVSLFDSSSIDGSAVIEGDVITTWVDTQNANNAIGTTTARPLLHIGTNGNRQVRFDGVDDALVIGQPANLMFQPQVEEYSFVIKLGDTFNTGISPIISRASNTNSSYVQYYAADTERWSIRNGGNALNYYSTPRIGNDLVIITVSTTTTTLRVRGIAVGTGDVGAVNTNYDIVIGNRHLLNYSYKGDIEFIAIYNKVLSAEEITAIETEFNL